MASPFSRQLSTLSRSSSSRVTSRMAAQHMAWQHMAEIKLQLTSSSERLQHRLPHAAVAAKTQTVAVQHAPQSWLDLDSRSLDSGSSGTLEEKTSVRFSLQLGLDFAVVAISWVLTADPSGRRLSRSVPVQIRLVGNPSVAVSGSFSDDRVRVSSFIHFTLESLHRSALEIVCAIFGISVSCRYVNWLCC